MSPKVTVCTVLLLLLLRQRLQCLSCCCCCCCNDGAGIHNNNSIHNSSKGSESSCCMDGERRWRGRNDCRVCGCGPVVALDGTTRFFATPIWLGVNHRNNVIDVAASMGSRKKERKEGTDDDGCIRSIGTEGCREEHTHVLGLFGRYNKTREGQRETHTTRQRERDFRWVFGTRCFCPCFALLCFVSLRFASIRSAPRYPAPLFA